MLSMYLIFLYFFFNDTAPTEIYTLSLHDALPILGERAGHGRSRAVPGVVRARRGICRRDRKSTRLNSSHRCISYAVFCLKKKNSEEVDVFHKEGSVGAALRAGV